MSVRLISTFLQASLNNSANLQSQNFTTFTKLNQKDFNARLVKFSGTYIKFSYKTFVKNYT